MADKQPSTPPSQSAKAAAAARKQARLSQALKANMARRKGQARARAVEAAPQTSRSTQAADTPTGTAHDAPYKED